MTAYRFAATHRANKVDSLLLTAKARKITPASTISPKDSGYGAC